MTNKLRSRAPKLACRKHADFKHPIGYEVSSDIVSYLFISYDT